MVDSKTYPIVIRPKIALVQLFDHFQNVHEYLVQFIPSRKKNVHSFRRYSEKNPTRSGILKTNMTSLPTVRIHARERDEPCCDHEAHPGKLV